jgi:hypothetical protein
MTQWDFAAELDRLLDPADSSRRPESMAEIVELATALAERARTDPQSFQAWVADNALPLIGQHLLASSVHAQPDPERDLPRTLAEWAAGVAEPSAAAAVEWLKQEHPALLRAWLLTRVEELIADELGRRADAG